MKLTYLTVPAEGPGPAAVVVHAEGGVAAGDMMAFARRGGLPGPVAVPFGDYSTTPSGMEVGGLCWYRDLPGGTGTDPLTLARAVVQVDDLLSDLSERADWSDSGSPVLVGWGQGGVVALGTGLLAPGAVAGVVAVDAPASHLAILPAALSLGASTGELPVLLASGGRADGAEDVEAAADELVRRGVTVEVVGPPTGEGVDPQVVADFVRAAWSGPESAPGSPAGRAGEGSPR